MAFWDHLGESDLHIAVIKNDLELVKKLIKDKNLLNTLNNWGFTPLDLVRYLDKEEILPLLESSSKKEFKIVPKGQKEISTYAEKEFSKLFGIHYLANLKFPNYQTLKKVCRKCPLLLKWTPIGTPYRNLAKKYHNELSTGQINDVSIRFIDETLGYGLFAERDFQNKDFIGTYTGCVKQLYHYLPQNPYCLQYPSLLPPIVAYVIDAEKEGNETRFLNHSDNPNLDMDILMEKNLLHIGFFTKRPIKKDEQLTFNYGKDYWRNREKPVMI